MSSRGVVKKPLSPQLGPAVRLLRMTGSGRWYSTRLERPLSGSCAAKRRAACNGIFAGATDRAASAKVRFVPHTDVLADKMLRHARMAAMRKLHRSVIWSGQSPVGAVHVGRGEIVWKDRCDAANGSKEPEAITTSRAFFCKCIVSLCRMNLVQLLCGRQSARRFDVAKAAFR